MDSLLTKTAQGLDILGVEDRAKIPLGLPDRLSINDISKLSYPAEVRKQKALIKTLVDACRKGIIEYYGDIDGWSYREDYFEGTNNNPYPLAKATLTMQDKLSKSTSVYIIRAGGYDCLIDKNEFKRYLQLSDVWPVRDGLIVNWWLKDGSQVESEANNNVGSLKVNKQKYGYDDIYTRRKISFDAWLNPTEGVSKPNIDVMKVQIIFKQIQQTDKILWNINLATFRRDFWQPYSKQKGLKKQSGRLATG